MDIEQKAISKEVITLPDGRYLIFYRYEVDGELIDVKSSEAAKEK